MKKYLSGVIACLALIVLVVPVLAKGPSAPAGSSNKAHLYLFQKDPSKEYSIVKDGAWGKMTYDQSGDEFNYVFNGHQLVAGTKYTLIYYPDSWPGDGLKCLGDGTSDDYGNVHIQNSLAMEPLPAEWDDNFKLTPPGAKIWLVNSDDVECRTSSKMNGWHPTQYLFEDKLITFTQ